MSSIRTLGANFVRELRISISTTLPHESPVISKTLAQTLGDTRTGRIGSDDTFLYSDDHKTL